MSKLNLQPNLENEFIILRPLLESDFDDLYEVAKDPMIWEQHPSHNRYTLEVFTVYFNDSIKSKGALVILDKLTNKIIGSSRFQIIDTTDQAIEIGWSFLSRNYWGGKYNKYVKDLMMNHAFRFVKDIIFYIGKNNFRSQKSVQKIGAERLTDTKYSHLIKKDENVYSFRMRKEDWISKIL